MGTLSIANIVSFLQRGSFEERETERQTFAGHVTLPRAALYPSVPPGLQGHLKREWG